MFSQPHLLQGMYAFEGRGLENPFPMPDPFSYIVPMGKRAQFVYFRAGNSTHEMVYFVLMRDGAPMRYFPLGAKANTHVPLAVVEDLMSSTHLETYLAAPKGVQGTVVVDIGLVEINLEA